MSEMMDYCAIRFKFKKEYEDPDKLIELLHSKGLFEEVKEMEDFYDVNGDLKIVWDYDMHMYLDKVFIDAESCDDINFKLSGNDFIKFNNEIQELFTEGLNGDNYALEEDCKIICLNWYNGSDMPVEW